MGKFPLAEAVEDAALMEVDLRPIVMGLKNINNNTGLFNLNKVQGVSCQTVISNLALGR